MVPATITVQGAFARWARRAAVLVALAIPFAPMPLAPCVLAVFLYNQIGHARRRRGYFKLSREGVESDEGVLVLPRPSFVVASTDLGDGQPPGIVFLDMDGVVSRMSFASTQERDAAFRALGFAERPFDVRSEGYFPPEVRALVGIAGALVSVLAIVVGARSGAVFAILAGALALVYSLRAVMKRDFRIGHDGIHVSAPLSRRWIPFAELRGVSIGHAWVRLHTTCGDVDIGGPSFGATAARAREALAASIREARARYEREKVPLNPLLESRDAAVFRTPQLTSEALLELVESARVEPAVRIRAASALLEDPSARDDEVRARVAACADQSANPELERDLRTVLARAGRPTCPS